MEAERRLPSSLSTEVEVNAMAPNSRSFDWKDLSIERSGTVSVATMSPHTEFPGQTSGRLFRRSGDGGGSHHGRSVMVFRFCDRDFFVHKKERRSEQGSREVCPNSKGLSVAKRSPNFLMLA
jgi:hypothetical protein